jgi:hypothetical protein
MANADTAGLRLLAKLVIGIVIMLVITGVAAYGVSIGVFQRIWLNLVARPEGPLSFRFFLQPLMAAIAALHDGLRDARSVRSPFVRAVLWQPENRVERLIEALNALDRIILLGLVMDAIYQMMALHRFYPTEAVIVALLLAVVPYVVLRGFITRGARRWWHGGPAMPRT